MRVSSRYLNERLKLNLEPEKIWDQLIKNGGEIDFTKKGADQDFLMRYIYPKVATDSVTAHFVLGMRQTVTENNGMHYTIPDIPIDVDPVHKHLNDCAGHIGAAGYYEPPMLKWLRHIDPNRDYTLSKSNFLKYSFGHEKYIVLSTNWNPDYLYYTPIVCWAWERFGWTPIVMLNGLNDQPPIFDLVARHCDRIFQNWHKVFQ